VYLRVVVVVVVVAVADDDDDDNIDNFSRPSNSIVVLSSLSSQRSQKF